MIGVDKKVAPRVSETDMEDVLEKYKPWQNTQRKAGEKADLRKAYISEAGLIRAFLRRVDLRGAKLSEAKLSEADLMSGMDITEEQIESAMMNDATKIPDYLEAPATRNKRVKKGTKE